MENSSHLNDSCSARDRGGPIRRTSLLWQAAGELSAAHAIYVVATGEKCMDAKLETLLIEDAAQINTRLVNESVDVSRFWSEYLREIAAGTTIDSACPRALTEAGINQWNLDQTSGAITRRLTSANDVFVRKFPRLNDQLELRGQPLRSRWDTYGVGLLRQIDQLIWQGESPVNWWPSRIEGLLVQPIRGGYGNHDGEGSRIWMEAVLTDVDASVSEILRVAFLVTHIAIDRSIQAVGDEARAQRLWAIAAVPIVLAAATELEIIQAASLPVSAAIEQWRIGTDAMAATVFQWWHEVSELAEPLPMTIRRLDEALSQREIQ